MSLPSLLVRDGLVTVERLERVFQRQVLQGGELDTVLLEMDLLQEQQILQYLSLVSGLPPASTDMTSAIEPGVDAVCPESEARSHGFVPMRRDGDTLCVLVRHPVDRKSLEASAKSLGVAIEPFVTPEYRFQLAFDLVYGRSPEARFTKIAESGGTPVSKAAPAPVEPEQPAQAEEPTVEAESSSTRSDAVTESNNGAGDTTTQHAVGSGIWNTNDGPLALSVDEAMELLGQASSRDEIFRAFLRGLHGAAEHAILFTIRGQVVEGNMAIVDGQPCDDEIRHVRIPLSQPSALTRIRETASPYIGPLSRDPKKEALVDALSSLVNLPKKGGVLLAPLVVRDRVIAVGLAFKKRGSLTPKRVGPHLPLASRASSALTELVASAARARRDSEVAEERARLEGLTPAQWVDRLACGDTTTDELLAVGMPLPDILEALDASFPGPIEAPRQDPASRSLRASARGPLLELVTRLGEKTRDLILAKLEDEDADVRFHATLCATEQYPDGALPELTQRLADSDYGIRAIAADAIGGYASKARKAALKEARSVLEGEDESKARAVADSIAMLGDVDSIPKLIELLDRGGALADAARRSLVALTVQDFGFQLRKWKNWWTKNKKSHRIEWLLDGLGHRDPAVRQSAAAELRRLTGQFFDFHYDLSKRERDEAENRWREWWAAHKKNFRKR